MDENLQHKKVIIGLFEATETTDQALAKISKKIIAYVKDEGANLNSMTITFKYVVNCEVLGLDFFFNGTYFGSTISKTYQYITTEKKVLRKNLKYVSIKFT